MCCIGNQHDVCNVRMVYTCSGCCDAGLASDLIGRRLRKAGYAQCGSSCLSGIAAEVKSFVDKALTAQEVICIDGCGIACASKVLKKVGINSKAFVLTEMGLNNGRDSLIENTVDDLFNQIIEKFDSSLFIDSDSDKLHRDRLE